MIVVTGVLIGHIVTVTVIFLLCEPAITMLSCVFPCLKLAFQFFFFCSWIFLLFLALVFP
ncbi:hypothetical protein NBRC111894_4616 [Sporolactobacillus inulinus]|uniref:Uncharacterized protein n=1 Tax=Sporolactobacillus inulinus TaxID=2078 RepID=A0A4Y1ZIM9_9BACL|nr:hypothetical protein NBRC111894_4616 [Sporolactobacillus inulinus]